MITTFFGILPYIVLYCSTHWHYFMIPVHFIEWLCTFTIAISILSLFVACGILLSNWCCNPCYFSGIPLSYLLCFIHLGYTYLGCGSPTNIGSYLWFVALLFPCIVLICTTILFCRDFTTSTDRICSVDFVSLRAASRSSAGCTPWTGRPAALCLHTIVFVPVTVMLDYAFGALPLCLAGLHVLLPWAVLYTFDGTDATIALVDGLLALLAITWYGLIFFTEVNYDEYRPVDVSF